MTKHERAAYLESEIEEVESRLASLGHPETLDFHGRMFRGQMLNLRKELYAELIALDAAHGPEEKR